MRHKQFNQHVIQDDADDPYLLLARAIVKQAADDYRAAVRAGNRRAARKIRAWFTSRYGSILCLDKGDLILELLDKEIVEEMKKEKEDGTKRS